MQTWGSGGIAPPFVTSALVGAEWLASHHDRITPGEIAPGAHLVEGCVGPTTGVDAEEGARICTACRESKPGYPTRGSVAVPTELSRLPKY
jgi:hypothetical protein